MKYILKVELDQTVEELQGSQSIVNEMDYNTQVECLGAVKGTIAFWFKDRPVKAFMTINKHQDNIDNKTNFPCEYYSIDIETLELTKIN